MSVRVGIGLWKRQGGGGLPAYYVDATGGNNANDGLTPATAWQTVAKVNGETLAAGDRVLFKRGEVWRETLTPPNSGSSGSPITFGAYGSGALPKISGMDTQTGFTEATAPAVLESEQSSGTDWNANIGRDASNYSQAFEYTPDEDHDVPQVEIMLEKVGSPTGTFTVEIWDDASDTPGSIITNGGSDTVDVSTVPGTGDWVTIAWSGTLPSLTSGSKYYFVVVPGFTLSTSNYIRAERNGSFTNHYRWRIQQGGTEDDYGPDGMNSRVYKAGAAGTLWEATVSTEPASVLMDGTYGVRVSTLNDLSAEYEWHWASNTLTLYAATDPDARYTAVEVSARDYTLDVNAESWLAFEDIRFEGANKYGLYLRGDESGNHTFDGLEIHAAAEFGIVTASADWVRNVTMTDCATSYCGSTGYKVNLKTDSWTLLRCTSDHDSCIDYEYDAGDDEQKWGGGIKLDGDNVTDNNLSHIIDACVVTNAGYKRDGTAVTTVGEQKGFGIWVDWVRPSTAGDGTIVRNCLTEGNLLSGYFCEKTQHSQWYYCAAILNGEYGLRVDADDDDIVNDNEFYNLTLHGNDINLYMAGGYTQSASAFEDNTFRNLILSGGVTKEILGKWGAENDGTRGSGNTYEYIQVKANATGVVEWRTAGSSPVNYDTIAAWEAAATGVANNEVGDPLYANEGGTSAADYKLTASSPCLAAGTDVSLSTDYFGNSVGSTPDMGFHDYTGENA